MSGHWGDDLPGEDWLPVVGYEGLYSVSNKGRLRSEQHVIVRKNGVPHTSRSQLLKLSRAGRKRNGSGHRLMVRLTDHDRRARTQYVHHLVLAAFVGPRPEGLCALHWDDDSSNNNLENLRYGTYSDNTRDQIRNGGHNHARKTHCKWGHEFTPGNTIRELKGDRPRRVCRTCKKSRYQRAAA